MTEHCIDDLIAATYNSNGECNSCYPYILSKCKRYASTEIETMGVCYDKHGGIVLLYNKNFLKKLTDGEVCAALKHEALHIFFQHIPRFMTRKNQKRVNIACDMAINQYLAGLPKGGVYPESFNLPRDLAADDYLKFLEENQKDLQINISMAGDGEGEGEGDGSDGQGSSKGDHSLWDKVVDEVGKICGNVEEMGVDTEEVINRIQQAVMNQLKDSNYGSKCAWAKYALDNIKKESKHNWKNDLRIMVSSVLSTSKKSSQKRVNRRMLSVCDDFIFPGKKRGTMPSILLVRDTSGSMFSPELQEAVLAEMIAIAKHSQVYVCDCDTEVHQIYKVKKKTEFKEYQGGGGTSFVEPFKVAKKMNVDAVIYMTDLYGYFPSARDVGKFERHTVWVTLEKGTPKTVPFGRLVQIAEEK